MWTKVIKRDTVLKRKKKKDVKSDKPSEKKVTKSDKLVKEKNKLPKTCDKLVKKKKVKTSETKYKNWEIIENCIKKRQTSGKSK